VKTPVGILTAADEQFLHQTTEMFVNVATSDPAWTERAYGCAVTKAGTVALHWGLGKYTNRNVMDGFVGVSVGREQRQIRFSRRLATDPLTTAVGPFRLEILEPLKTSRIVLEESEHQPISFDLVQTAIVPPWTEERSYVERAFRRAQDEMRYVLPTTTLGWIAYNGDRFELTEGDNFGFRDHSWGIKQNTGPAAPGVEDRAKMPAGLRYRMMWCPAVLERPDQSLYRVHLFAWEASSARSSNTVNESRIFDEGVHAKHAHKTIMKLQFDPATREPLGGEVVLVMEDGTQRPFMIEVVAESRVCLGLGLYHGYKGHYHGEDRGTLHVEGDHVVDTADPATSRSLHQIRDILVRITDRVAGGSGYGILNSEITGEWPALGLDDSPWR
jgi:hypothetical protein